MNISSDKNPVLLETAKRVMEQRKRQVEQKELAEKSLRAFVEQAWHVVEPSTPFIGGWNLDAVCDHLQGVSDGHIRNIAINVPPRTSKSTIVSVMWPAWEWITKPEIRWLFSSYTSKLSLRDSQKCRRVIDSGWYQANWKDRYQLIGDQNTKENYENDKTGQRIATSVSGIGVGAGGDRIVCLAGDTVIQTHGGPKTIQEIVDRELSVKVLSFDHISNQAELQPIVAVEQSAGRESVRVTFSNGKTLECTADHPIFCPVSGYVSAVKLRHGDRVLDAESKLQMPSLRDTVLSVSGTSGQIQERHHGLQYEVLREVGNGAEQPPISQRENRENVQDLLCEVSSEALRPKEAWGELLLGEMPRIGYKREEPSKICKSSNCGVLELRQSGNVTNHEADREAGLLHSGMREHRPSGVYQGEEQRSLRPWDGSGAISSRLREDRAEDSGAGWEYLSPVWDHAGDVQQGIRRSSHRLHQDQQQARESDNTVPILPREGSRFAGASTQMAETFVVSCERIPTPTRVFNIRVAKNHNYFANGILVHNCDDPNNVEDMESDPMRQGVLDWWDQTMSTRGNNPKTVARVIVQQRLHEQDLTGHVLEQGGYMHLMLPMRFEKDRRCVTFFGGKTWQDPRTKEGELLWPERFGEKEIAELEKRLGSYMAAGQLQQRPSPAGGGMLKTHWWRYWQPRGANLDPVPVKMPDGTIAQVQAIELPEKFDTVIQSWDMSLKEEKTSDFVVGGVLAAKAANRFVLDLVRDRMDLPKTVMAVRRLSALHPNAHTKLVEDKANGPAVMQSLHNKIGGFVAVNPIGGKLSRAAAASPMLESGNWYLPHPALAPWVDGFIQECSGFPKAQYDDQVDMWSQGAARLINSVSVEDEDDATRLRIQSHKQAGWTA